MALSRRDFLGFTAAGAAGLTLGEWGRRAIASLDDPRSPISPGRERWATAVCGQCPAACGIRVRLVDDRPVKVEGNPLCPLSRGKSCPKGQASLLAYYDPDRLRGPLRRAGGQRRGELQPISWEEAIAELAARLSRARATRGPGGAVFLAPVDHGPRGELLRRFCRASGSARILEVGSLRDGAARLAQGMTLGSRTLPVYDLEKTRYLLSLGTPLLDGWSSAVWVHRAYGHFRRGRGATRGRFVQAEPRLSPTAAKADEWVPLPAGGEADLALGLAHVLIRESRFDSAFVSSHCTGFEQGLRELIRERYDPGSVSGRTGVPVVEIIRVAREFSASRPALALCEGYPFSKGLEASWAALVLNALVGSVDAPGGLLLPEPLPAPHLPQLPPADGGLGSANGDGHLPPAFDGDKGALDDAPPELLVFMGRGTSLPIAEKSLEQAGFIVSFSSYLDETTEGADLVLPENAFLECWQGAVPEPALAGPHIALARPGAAPLLDTRDSADVLLTVARELGGAVAEALPWSSFTDLLKEQARVLFEARRGSPYSSSFEGDWLRQLEHAGLWSRSYGDFDDFWEKCLQAGGWWDPGFEPGQALRSLETPSGKIELFPDFIRRLHERGRKPVAISPPAGHPPSEEDFPLALQVFEVLPLAGLTDRNQASLYEILGPHLQASWEPWAELNPDTAARLNLHDRELVWIESPAGRIRVRVILYPGAMPGAVFIPLGVLQKAGGRWVPKGTDRAIDLLSPSRDAGSGLPTGIGTRVRVVRG